MSRSSKNKKKTILGPLNNIFSKKITSNNNITEHLLPSIKWKKHIKNIILKAADIIFSKKTQILVLSSFISFRILKKHLLSDRGMQCAVGYRDCTNTNDMI